MKKLSMGMAAAAVMALSATAWGQVNATCPVKVGKAVKANLTTTYKGKLIGFC